MKKGFTLVELVMAIMITSIALSALLGTFVLVTSRNVDFDSITVGMNLARGKLEEVSNQTFNSVTSEALTSFGGDFSGYSSLVVVQYVSREVLDVPVVGSTNYKKVAVWVSSSSLSSSIELETLITDVANE